MLQLYRHRTVHCRMRCVGGHNIMQSLSQIEQPTHELPTLVAEEGDQLKQLTEVQIIALHYDHPVVL